MGPSANQYSWWVKINFYRLQNKILSLKGKKKKKKSWRKRGQAGVKTDYNGQVLIRMSQGQLMLSHFIIQILVVGIYNSTLLQPYFPHWGKKKKKDVSFYHTKQVTVSSKGLNAKWLDCNYSERAFITITQHSADAACLKINYGQTRTTSFQVWNIKPLVC